MNEQQAAQLNTLLMQGISLLESLSAIYDRELETLSSKDLNKLSDVTQEKTDLLNKFHRFTQDREALLASFGINQDPQSYQLAGGIAEAPENSAIQDSHDLIKAHLAELQKKNKRNEQAIYRNQQNVNQLLAIVRGQNNQNKIYDKDGNSGMYKAQSRLGKA